MTIAQRNSDPVGEPTWGSGPTLKENVPNPVRLSRPTKIRAPTPAESKSGDQHQLHHRAAQPRHLHEKEGADDGRAQERGDGGEAPGDTDHDHGHRRRVPLEQVDREDAEAAPDCDQRRLRAQHRAEAQRGEGRRDDAEELDGLHRPAGFEALRGLVAPGSGQEANGQSDEQPAQGQPGQRPPQRLSVEPEAVREIDEDLVLELGDGVQEEVGNGRHGDADDGPQEEQDDVAPRPDDRESGPRAPPVPDPLAGAAGRSLSPPTTLHSTSGLLPGRSRTTRAMRRHY